MSFTVCDHRKKRLNGFLRPDRTRLVQIVSARLLLTSIMLGSASNRVMNIPEILRQVMGDISVPKCVLLLQVDSSFFQPVARKVWQETHVPEVILQLVANITPLSQKPHTVSPWVSLLPYSSLPELNSSVDLVSVSSA